MCVGYIVDQFWLKAIYTHDTRIGSLCVVYSDVYGFLNHYDKTDGVKYMYHMATKKICFLTSVY